MQDLDPKCRHFGILWHFMAFYSILWRFGIFAKKSNRKSNPIFPILSDFFRFLDFSRLLDFPIPQLLYGQPKKLIPEGQGILAFAYSSIKK